MKEKILEDLKEAHESAVPVKLTIGENTVDMHILAFDKLEALGEKGGVVSFFIREVE